jgi:hypothetical protein
MRDSVAMPWLISYRSQEHILTRKGRVFAEPSDNLWLSTDHPAIFAAKFFVELRALGAYGNENLPDNDDERRAIEIVRIYSAIEVPHGILTDDQARAISGWLPSELV